VAVEMTEVTREKILANSWCPHCQTATSMKFQSAVVKEGNLLLLGFCSKCGKDVARLIGPEK